MCFDDGPISQNSQFLFISPPP
jgi:ankyrin repeat protein